MTIWPWLRTRDAGAKIRTGRSPSTGIRIASGLYGMLKHEPFTRLVGCGNI